MNHLYGQASGQTRQLEEKLAALQRISQQMDSTWRMQVVRSSTAKSDVWKRRVEQVAEETDALRAALDKHTHRERRRASSNALAYELPRSHTSHRAVCLPQAAGRGPGAGGAAGKAGRRAGGERGVARGTRHKSAGGQLRGQ